MPCEEHLDFSTAATHDLALVQVDVDDDHLVTASALERDEPRLSVDLNDLVVTVRPRPAVLVPQGGFPDDPPLHRGTMCPGAGGPSTWYSTLVNRYNH
jgi:hypothetical protein